MSARMTVETGIQARHSRCCPGEPYCICQPSYEAFITLRGSRRKLRETFHSVEEARAWRGLMKSVLRTPAVALTELRQRAERLMTIQEEAYGDAIPHLHIAYAHLAALEAQAEADGDWLRVSGPGPDHRTTVRRTATPTSPSQNPKRCSSCHLMKPASEFHRKTAARDGLGAYCKTCLRIKRADERRKAKEFDRLTRKR